MKHKVARTSLVICTILVILIAVGSFVFKQLNTPSNGTVTSQHVQTTSAKIQFNITPVEVDGSQATFSYPAALSVIATQPAALPILMTYSYGYRDTESWLLAITVNQLNGTALTFDNSYEFRTTQPNIYRQSTADYGGKTYTIMTDTQDGGFSEVAYSFDGTRSADISLYGTDPSGNANLSATMAMILRTWQWK
jgi:hypothetical protein